MSSCVPVCHLQTVSVVGDSEGESRHWKVPCVITWTNITNLRECREQLMYEQHNWVAATGHHAWWIWVVGQTWSLPLPYVDCKLAVWDCLYNVLVPTWEETSCYIYSMTRLRLFFVVQSTFHTWRLQTFDECFILIQMNSPAARRVVFSCVIVYVNFLTCAHVCWAYRW